MECHLLGWIKLVPLPSMLVRSFVLCNDWLVVHLPSPSSLWPSRPPLSMWLVHFICLACVCCSSICISCCSCFFGVVPLAWACASARSSSHVCLLFGSPSCCRSLALLLVSWLSISPSVMSSGILVGLSVSGTIFGCCMVCLVLIWPSSTSIWLSVSNGLWVVSNCTAWYAVCSIGAQLATFLGSVRCRWCQVGLKLFWLGCVGHGADLKLFLFCWEDCGSWFVFPDSPGISLLFVDPQFLIASLLAFVLPAWLFQRCGLLGCQSRDTYGHLWHQDHLGNRIGCLRLPWWRTVHWLDSSPCFVLVGHHCHIFY